MPVTKYGVGQDAESQAALKSAQQGDERTPIPGEVDQPSVVSTVDGGTSIPSKVDSPSLRGA
jgi:hypothetical protein